MVSILLSFEQDTKRAKNVMRLLINHTNKTVWHSVGGMGKPFKSWEVPKWRLAVPCWKYISGCLLAPAETHRAETHQQLGHSHMCLTDPEAADCMSDSWFGDLFHSLVIHHASDIPRRLPVCPPFSTIMRGCQPSIVTALQCCVSGQELCDNNSPSEGKPEDPLPAL